MPVLFTLTTGRVRLIWTGPASAVRDARETVRAVAAPGATAVLDVGGQLGDAAALRLDEETTYGVWLESLGGQPVDLLHADPVLTAALAVARGGTIVHGPVRFGAQAGRSRFTVAAGGVPEASVELTVAPTKATWAEVEAMRVRVEGAAAGVPLAALRPAVLGLERTSGPASAPAWLALLRDATPHLVRTLAAVARDPETVLSRPRVAVRPSALRRASGETLRALRGAAVWPERVPGRPAHPSLDTPAHRWLAAGLDAALARARALRDAEAARPETPRRAAILSELDRLRAALARSARLGPLAAAGRPAPPVPPRAVLVRPPYRAAAEVLAALRSALRLAAGPVAVPAQDLSALYEAWAALETVDALARALGATPPARPFGARTVGADVRLGQGAAHAVRIAGERGEAEIVRTPRFGGPPALLVQIPDLLVTLRLPGRPARRVVLDAKYRVDAGRAGAGGAAPPGDALGALHRYRDAIVDADGRALVRTAAVLFPAHVAAGFEASRLWTSLGTLGVGAVPLLPGATVWLDRLAERLVSERP